MRSTYLLRLSMGCALLMLALLFAPAAGASSVLAAPAADLASGCTGQYFNGTGLNDPAVFVRTDPAINFYWPEGTSPGTGINTNNYSVRWTCVIDVPNATTYTFNMVNDDGMNVIVDGTLLMWAWYDQGPTLHSNSVALSAGTHVVKVEYYNATNGGTAQVAWNGSGNAVYYPPATGNTYYPPVTTGGYYSPLPSTTYNYNPAYYSGSLLTSCSGEYFANPTLSGTPAFTRVDAGINYNWPTNTSPGAGLNVNYYSVRWTCNVNVPATATYTFDIMTDDGMNIVVDNNVLIWAWRDQSATAYSRPIALTAGLHTVRVDYYNAAYDGVAQVRMH